ncbi:non-ribosomal peptide synthetase [Micromonospora lutea]|uniref:Carrier domain-containing protein n=1 Tax=Micromonospora lutea TaxID=419825 RepID=A0ABQ4IT13_9ACTN|nr:non-ribosomal peptide synthetase [Micromonospora lutea]GIJ21054.1 hypothetical protein Vlu01_16780 [Micromonospora lutea]
MKPSGDQELTLLQAAPIQQQWWHRRQLRPATHFVQCEVHIDRPVKADRLAAALAATVESHEALRTALVAAPGGDVAQAVGRRSTELRVLTVPSIPTGAQRDDLRREEIEALDPADGQVLRMVLLTTASGGEGRDLLLVTAHAALVDAVSLRIIVARLASYYSVGVPQDADGVAPLQYPDFAAWHQDLLAAEETTAARRAARELLAKVAHDGPARPEPAVVSSAVHRQWLDAELTAEVDAFAGTRSLPVGAVLAAAFAATCHRWWGDRPVAVEFADEARGFPTLRDAVGAFARDLPVPGPVDVDEPFAAWVARLAGDIGRFAEIVDHLDPRLPELAAPAANRIGFSFSDDSRIADLAECGFHVGAEHASARTETHLACHRRDRGLELTLTTSDAMVPAALAESMLALLRDALARPQTPLSGLAWLTRKQRDVLVQRAAEAGPRTVSEDTVVAAFAARASATPDRPAVSDGAGELTYAELDARSRTLAAWLVGRGLGRGDKVVVSLERGTELLVCVLAVLRAGAAFVPVDPAHPVRRFVDIAEDTDAALVMCTSTRQAELGQQDRPVMVPERELPAILATAEGTLPTVAPADLAYVLYTSGTTGLPSGVLVPHAALMSYLAWSAEAYRMREGTGVLTHSSISFDFTLTTMLAPLLAGQRVEMLRDGGAAGIAAALRTGGDLSVLKVTPTHLDLLAQLLTPEQVRGSVRTLVVGGEALDARSVRLFREAGVRVVNEYGPTETVVGSTAYTCTADTPSAGPVPIGRPIPGTRVYLTDADGELVPDGAVGELCIGGAGVSDGYLNRAELTTRRFVAEPGDDPAARMYRTGDLARWLPSGDLEYLGRIDEQLKINGVRVEPGEIESVLADHPLVARAVVLARHNEDVPSPVSAAARLIAYVVCDEPVTVDGTELAEWCRARLPETLVPRAFVMLRALPLTVNGKLDRAALPRPDVRTREDATLVGPRTEVEEILAGSIASVLGLDAVGIDENYFVLGGDSIRSVMVTSRARARGVEVSVADLHAHPTVRACAEYLRSRTHREAPPELAPFALVSDEDRGLMPDNVEDAFPLNLLQEGMIFHRDFAAKSAVYHAIATIRIKVRFDADVMRMAVDQLVERHPMLRVSFDMGTFSQPLQLVHRRFPSPLQIEDLRDLSTEAQDERVQQWIEDEKARGFELDEYPLIRFMVQRLSDEEWQFTYGFHHEIIDGWSEALMIAELFGHYFSVIFDEPITMRPPVSSMRDAVALELEALRDEKNFEFWNTYLADATVMRLPRSGVELKVDKGARDIVRIAVPVDVALSDQLKQVALGLAVPLKSVLMAAHVAVMSTYGGHADTLTYTVTNGRPETADGSSAIGLFVNSLALRVATTGGTWRDLVAVTLGSERASLPYRRLPMAELKRHQGSEPLAETLFFYTNYHVFGVLDQWRERGVTHVATELYGESTFPFCGIFRLNRENGHLEVRLEYDSLQFSAETMAGIKECYAQVLAAIAADPDSRYDTRSFAPQWEQDRLRELGRSPAAVLDERCLHQLVEEQATRRPDAVAVELDGRAVTYRELDRRANRLAHLLRSRGVRPDQVVGVLAERSVEQIVSLLAVLKAGGAYLPLDPGQPDERLIAIVEDAGCALVVTQEQYSARGLAELPTVVVDESPMPAGGYPDTAPISGVHCANAAYVIYTSGSTGQPKGVVVEHRNAVFSTLARHAYYAEKAERFLLLSSFTFDSSVAGIFWTLSQGGTLLLPPEGYQREPESLVRLIATARPTHTLGIPSLLKLLLDQGEPDDLASLRSVISAGEACPVELVESAARKLPTCSFHNEYGPTEATVWATAWTANAGDDLGERLQVPIGAPVPGGQALVLNHHGQLVPLGVTGELSIAGPGVARGYLGRPAETAVSFRPSRFPASPGERCYATGDLARAVADGFLEFQGRADHQVKIHGFRVELGAVEALLDAHPQIARSIVVAQGDPMGDKTLVGYVVPAVGSRLVPEEIQQYVRERLPKYMVPAAVLVMESVPLTPTGKVDRGLLPPISQAQLKGGAPYQAPSTDIERALAAIWCRVLRVDQVGVHDRFFDIGGESLRAMQVIVATNKMFHVSLSVRRLFEAPTISELALDVSEAVAAAGGHGAGNE